jgi:hypothetical protein
MKNPKKHNKGPRMRRNALPAAIARLTRSAPRRRAPTAEEIAAAAESASSVGSQLLWTLPSQNHSPPVSCGRMTVDQMPIPPSAVQRCWQEIVLRSA